MAQVMDRSAGLVLRDEMLQLSSSLKESLVSKSKNLSSKNILVLLKFPTGHELELI